MSDAVSALAGKATSGSTTVREAGLVGMVTIRADLGNAEAVKAIKSATGVAVPKQRQITTKNERSLGWMSPDELLLICPYADAEDLVAKLGTRLSDHHHMAVNVSDARAIFDIEGPHAREALAKVCPVDLAPGVFEPGELRRTRLAQVPAAFWMTGPESFRLVCFRSVATYVFDVLALGAKDGAEVNYF